MRMGLRLCLITLVSEDIVVFFGDINLIFYVILTYVILRLIILKEVSVNMEVL